jgi:hypothetical protein
MVLHSFISSFDEYNIKIFIHNIKMEYVYLLIRGSDWEDIIVFLSKEDAIKESINNSNHRIEIFSKTNNAGYRPTNNYYKNGEYVHQCK